MPQTMLPWMVSPNCLGVVLDQAWVEAESAAGCRQQVAQRHGPLKQHLDGLVVPAANETAFAPQLRRRQLPNSPDSDDPLALLPGFSVRRKIYNACLAPWRTFL